MDSLEKDFVFAVEWSEQRLPSFFPVIKELQNLNYYNMFSYRENNYLKRIARISYSGEIEIAFKMIKQKNLNAESIFIHEISEWIFSYFLGGGKNHALARYIENIRRNELGLDKNSLL